MMSILSLCLFLSLPQVSGSPGTQPQVVIDMHAHAFNARYLTICGILEAWGLPPYLASLLEKYFYSKTKLDDFSEQASTKEDEVSNRDALKVQKLTTGDKDEVSKLLDPLYEDEKVAFASQEPELWAAIRELYQDEELDRIDKWRIRRFLKNNASPEMVSALPAESGVDVYIENLMKSAPLLQEGIIKEGTKGYALFVCIALQRESDVIKLLNRDIKAQLFVHHMMDMDFVYGAYGETKYKKFLKRGWSKEWNGLIPFRQQIDRVEALGKQNPNLLYFVAFDPFRRKENEKLDLENIDWPEGTRWDLPDIPPEILPASLYLVDKAMQGTAAGVKFYPPSGYRPTDNEKLPKPDFFNREQFPWILPSRYFAQRHHYKTRYKHRNPQTLDAVNRALFEYCHKYDIPIFSHHTTVGVEAYKDYGKKVGNPKYWRPVLEDKRFESLRVCIGHSGGGKGWSSDSEKIWQDSYDKQAYKLAVEFKNVYIDFGDSEWIFDEDKAYNFKERLLCLLKGDREGGDHKYKLAEKIVFGSDWYMITRLKALGVSRSKYLAAFVDLFSDRRFTDEQRNAFFAGNAANFLNLKDYLKKDELSEGTKTYLKKLLARIPRPTD